MRSNYSALCRSRSAVGYSNRAAAHIATGRVSCRARSQGCVVRVVRHGLNPLNQDDLDLDRLPAVILHSGSVPYAPTMVEVVEAIGV